MPNGLDFATVRDLGTALLIGALVGTEREKRKSVEAEAGIGGLRTFILVALLGEISEWLANVLHMPALLAAVLIVVGASAFAGYALAALSLRDSLGATVVIVSHELPRILVGSSADRRADRAGSPRVAPDRALRGVRAVPARVTLTRVLAAARVREGQLARCRLTWRSPASPHVCADIPGASSLPIAGRRA